MQIPFNDPIYQGYFTTQTGREPIVSLVLVDEDLDRGQWHAKRGYVELCGLGDSTEVFRAKVDGNPTEAALYMARHDHKTDHRDTLLEYVEEACACATLMHYFPLVYGLGQLVWKNRAFAWLTPQHAALVSTKVAGMSWGDWLERHASEVTRCHASVRRVKQHITSMHQEEVRHGSLSIYNLMILDDTDAPQCVDWNMAHHPKQTLCRRFGCFTIHDRAAEDWQALYRSLSAFDRDHGTSWASSL